MKSGWLDGAELLLKNGADPDIRDAKSNTSLLLASPPTVRLKMTQLLLRYKADPSLKDQEGNTALHKAVKLAYEPLIVEELLKAGTPVNSANLAGDTPLMICVKAGNYQYADALISREPMYSRNLAARVLSPSLLQRNRGGGQDRLEDECPQRDNFGNA